MRRETHFTIWYAVAAVLVVIMIQDFLSGRNHVKTITYSEFQATQAKGDYAPCTIFPGKSVNKNAWCAWAAKA